jgi:osmoprotectant transport system permease protein
MIRFARLAPRLVLLSVLLAFLVRPQGFSGLFSVFTDNGAAAIYSQADLLSLTVSHLAIAGGASFAALVMALAAAILVTRSWGRSFLPLSRSVANIGQTFPPVAVLALAVPSLGFGNGPTFVALLLYGLLPIFENALTGLSRLPQSVMEAARGNGMTEMQVLWKVELPLSLPLIIAGFRLSLVIGLSTATIGSTVAAHTLGEVIIAGLQSNNLAFVIQGGMLVAGIAVLAHDALTAAEHFARQQTRLAA